MRKKACVLLSGGLDSVVSAFYTQKYKAAVEFCLFFDYGQKAFIQEKKACEYYANLLNAKLYTIKLPFLKEITGTALVNTHSVPSIDLNDLQDNSITTQSMLDVWVPNRNGLFLNIAGSFADSKNIDFIIAGFNKEEAQTFKDNSKSFINSINKCFKFSTLISPTVYSPFYSKDKSYMIKTALKLNIPLNRLYSCYNGYKKMCGICESCVRLKRALSNNDIAFNHYFEI
ncbi:MAG: 7-cyano-7-deazaguanine synthase [Candidatus Muirbacterium halophilum]|nr:7-cyano-7-deazaguanine synthase [Candidatus Muirbacterium halophilum]